MLTHWRWRLTGACTLAALGLLAGTLLAGGAWLISLLGVRFILAVGGVGAFLGWIWSFGKATLPSERRIVCVARQQFAPPPVAFAGHRVSLPDSIRQRMKSFGCAPL